MCLEPPQLEPFSASGKEEASAAAESFLPPPPTRAEVKEAKARLKFYEWRKELSAARQARADDFGQRFEAEVFRNQDPNQPD